MSGVEGGSGGAWRAKREGEEGGGGRKERRKEGGDGPRAEVESDHRPEPSPVLSESVGEQEHRHEDGEVHELRGGGGGGPKVG